MVDRIGCQTGERLDVGFRINASVVEATPGLLVGQLLTVDSITRHPKERRQLNQASNAAASDMETMGVAQVCRDHKTRFLAIRVVTEEVNDELPRSLENLLEQTSLAGKLGAASGVLLKKPSTVKEWWRYQDQASRAADRLARFLSGIIAQLE